MSRERTINVSYLARVEGEGALHVRIGEDGVEQVELNIFEPPRFFEAFLRGRHFAEAPDVTARICGICPVAYQMSAVHAMEAICGVKIDGPLRELRRLLYCGEWIESHALHIYMLHAPDFLGYESAIHMAKDHGPVVERGLHLKKVGNEIVDLLGGRAVHPINVKLGGFYKLPSKKAFRDLAEHLKKARDEAMATVSWVADFPFPDFEQEYEFVSLNHPHEYPFNEGRLVSSRGLDIAVTDYEEHFTEEHVAHSSALHSVMHGRGHYFCGPLARYSLQFAKLSPMARELARSAGLGPVCRNPFQSIVVRAVETFEACEEALRIIAQYEEPDAPCVPVEPVAGVGCAATEAPRGVLYHRYQIDEAGLIQDAKIVPPTSQNQRTMEEDLRAFIPSRLHLPDDQLTWQCEQAIRNYDPCISCATHFLKLEIERPAQPQPPSPS